jgi:hypothetical protein
MKRISMFAGILIVMFLFIWFYHNNFSFKKFTELNTMEAKECLKRIKEDSITKELKLLTLVKDEKMAITIAEPILFNLYGEKNIKMERPYKICLLNGYWVIIGTFPRVSKFFQATGGNFEMIINSKNAEIISVCHYK